MGQPFTTSFHTRFPDYLAFRTGMKAERFWPIVRRFDAPASAILVATDRLTDELAGHGLPRTRQWGRSVDLATFRPDGPSLPGIPDMARPLLLSVGRLAVEKNLDAFLSLDRLGTKLVVGDGPARAGLQRRYPDAVFTGTLTGATLASAYRAADALVFASRTDTFGLVAIEALACGTPVAALPAPGPADIVTAAKRAVGAVDADLNHANDRALACDRDDCAAEGRRHGWSVCTDQFTADPGVGRRAARLPSGPRRGAARDQHRLECRRARTPSLRHPASSVRPGPSPRPHQNGPIGHRFAGIGASRLRP